MAAASLGASLRNNKTRSISDTMAEEENNDKIFLSFDDGSNAAQKCGYLLKFREFLRVCVSGGDVRSCARCAFMCFFFGFEIEI